MIIVQSGLGMAGAFLSLARILPDRYPLKDSIESYLTAEHTIGQMLDYGLIVPRLQRLFEWSADALGEPALGELIRDGSPVYACPMKTVTFGIPTALRFQCGC